MPGTADVVDHDRVHALAAQLLAAVLERAVAVFGGEADERLLRATRAPASSASTSVVGLELDGEALAPVLLELALVPRRRA